MWSGSAHVDKAIYATERCTRHLPQCLGKECEVERPKPWSKKGCEEERHGVHLLKKECEAEPGKGETKKKMWSGARPTTRG